MNLSASSRGRAAMEELGQQVVATLAGQDPTRRAFPEGLAFDTVPEDTDDDAWSGAELLAADEVRAVTGKGVVLGIVTQPLFWGITAGLHVRGVDVDGAERAWTRADGLALVRPGRLRPRAVTGRASVFWGRLRADPGGDGVHVWCVADPIGGVATDAVRTLAWLYGAGLLGES